MTPHYRRRLLLLLGAAAAAAVACSSGNKNVMGPSTGGTPTGIAKVSGDNQSAEWGAALPAPLVIKVTDSVGSPVTNTPVSWLTTFDDAPQVQSITTTNGSGETQITPTLVGMPGAFSVSAAINAHSVTFAGTSNVQLASGATGLAASLFANCGLTKQGAAFCWGDGELGFLGNGDTSMHEGAVPVSGGYTFTQVSLGSWMACGIATGGALYCWGSRGYEGYGNGTTPDGTISYTPQPAGNGRKFTQISVGGAAACGMSGGAAYCWGDNGQGTLGTGNTTTSWSPVAVATPTGVTFASVGVGFGFACALSTVGSVYCWGNNFYGTLGTGTSSPASSLVPIAVTGGQVFTSLAVGTIAVCGLTAAGSVYCWGEGVNGNGTSGTEYAPTAIHQTGLTFTQVSLSSINACALTAAGAAYCWGDNSKGELGSGSFSTSGLTPVAVTGGLTFSTIGAGGALACGITTGGSTYCWGSNTLGQLGIPISVDTAFATPQLVPGLGQTG